MAALSRVAGPEDRDQYAHQPMEKKCVETERTHNTYTTVSRDLHICIFGGNYIHVIDFCSLTAVREGIALSEEGLSPYAGDIFHEVIMCYTP